MVCGCVCRRHVQHHDLGKGQKSSVNFLCASTTCSWRDKGRIARVLCCCYQHKKEQAPTFLFTAASKQSMGQGWVRLPLAELTLGWSNEEDDAIPPVTVLVPWMRGMGA